MRPQASFGHIALALVGLCIAGCMEYKDRSVLLEGVTTVEKDLTMKHTGIPDMKISLPEGYEVSWEKMAEFDKFFIFNPDDSVGINPGMILLDVGPSPYRVIGDTAEFTESGGTIAGHDVVWKERSIKEGRDNVLHHREMTSGTVLAEYKNDKGESFKIRVFVVGSNPDLVELLTACSQTIRPSDSPSEI